MSFCEANPITAGKRTAGAYDRASKDSRSIVHQGRSAGDKQIFGNYGAAIQRDVLAREQLQRSLDLSAKSRCVAGNDRSLSRLVLGLKSLKANSNTQANKTKEQPFHRELIRVTITGSRTYIQERLLGRAQPLLAEPEFFG